MKNNWKSTFQHSSKIIGITQIYDKMSERDSFIGLHNNMQTSLEKHGFVCRNDKSDQYYIIYKHDDGYDEAFLCESDIKDFLDFDKSYLKKNKIYEFYGCNSVSDREFEKFPFSNKLDMLLSFFGTKEILGNPIQSLTFEEALHIVENE